MKLAVPVLRMARPGYDAPAALLLMAMRAMAPLVPRPPFHPAIAPSSVEKRNDAFVPVESTMPVAPVVVTEPAGVPPVVAVPVAGGTMTWKEMVPVEEGTT